MTQSNSPYRAIVFDFGGVLVDWNPRHLYRKLLAEDQIDPFLAEIGFHAWNLQMDQGRPFAEAVAELSARYPHRADLINAFDQRWQETTAGPIQATVDILHALKQAGYPVYGLTNWSAEKFRLFQPTQEFFAWFDEIVVSGEVSLIKPDPRIYNLLLDKIGRKAEECIFIDDSLPNVTAAAQLGFTAIRFESSAQLKSALSDLGVLP